LVDAIPIESDIMVVWNIRSTAAERCCLAPRQQRLFVVGQ
jgi:hypothetical protein